MGLVLELNLVTISTSEKYMSEINITQIPVMTDNFIYILHNNITNEAAVIDPAEAGPVIDMLNEKDLTLTHILNTHHHYDHVGANIELKEKYGSIIVGSRDDHARIPGIDVLVREGETVTFGNESAQILEVSGHTTGHIAYYFKGLKALFCGDTLFSMGCGRLFEGSPETMWQSIQKLMALPNDTLIYCAHEYTEANGDFALSIEPNNGDLKLRMDDVRKLRAEGLPTIPSNIGVELRTNPFMRPSSLEIQNTLDMTEAQPHEIFREIRTRKDNF